ncbi:hypothetical protein G5I_06476 [Acromyrmex echinatior]|uniref:Fibronectin type-III domain-containing protein n=1 Tax=Acromyrmex echinatior TaxID=103372 RepID=F4WL52_ACREC|nr:hypothetical protein G5I_06476 [Acromyrmex echinatior]
MKFQQCDHDEVIQIIRSTKRGMRGAVLVQAPGFVLSHKGPRKSTVNRIDISNDERRTGNGPRTNFVRDISYRLIDHHIEPYRANTNCADKRAFNYVKITVGVTACGNGRHKQRERSRATAEKPRRARSEKDDDSILRDVPDPPERPLVISYTSKAVNISWAPGVNSHNTPISQYVIYTRSYIPDWLDPLEAHFAEKTGISQSDSQRDNNI